MSTVRFLDRLLPRKDAAPTAPVRVDVCPPELWPAKDSVWASTLRWLTGTRNVADSRLQTPLERARSEFVAAMNGLLDRESGDLMRRAQHARSLRELWHLRSELYTLIACRLSQGEADARLARVNEHFPMRAARNSVLGPVSTLSPTDSQLDERRHPA